MRLYTNKDGQWFGTQADARKGAPRNWVEVDVPTSKQDLINWLCANKVGSAGPQVTAPEVTTTVEPEVTSGLLTTDAYSWVSWALNKLVSGQKSEAEEMLKLGLKEQVLGLKKSGAMTSDGFLVREK